MCAIEEALSKGFGYSFSGKFIHAYFNQTFIF